MLGFRKQGIEIKKEENLMSKQEENLKPEEIEIKGAKKGFELSDKIADLKTTFLQLQPHFQTMASSQLRIEENMARKVDLEQIVRDPVISRIDEHDKKTMELLNILVEWDRLNADRFSKILETEEPKDKRYEREQTKIKITPKIELILSILPHKSEDMLNYKRVADIILEVNRIRETFGIEKELSQSNISRTLRWLYEKGFVGFIALTNNRFVYYKISELT
jgi:DNA-binding transcriptional ArsR family regulator